MNEIQDKKHSTLDKRLKTFENWKHKTLTPLRLALAGFYYTGESDKVICYCCGLGMHEWKPDDDPFAEHANYSPFCSFIQINKLVADMKGSSKELNVQHGETSK